MHKIAGMFLAVALIGTVSFSQSAPPKPAASPAPKTAAHSTAASPQIPIPDIKYTRFVLKNGLTVLVHEDHKAPIVAVNTWYHVAGVFNGRAKALRTALIDGLPGLVWAVRGEPKVAFAFTIEDGHVTGIEQLADPATVAALEIEFV